MQSESGVDLSQARIPDPTKPTARSNIEGPATPSATAKALSSREQDDLGESSDDGQAHRYSSESHRGDDDAASSGGEAPTSVRGRGRAAIRSASGYAPDSEAKHPGDESVTSTPDRSDNDSIQYEKPIEDGSASGMSDPETAHERTTRAQQEEEDEEEDDDDDEEEDTVPLPSMLLLLLLPLQDA